MQRQRPVIGRFRRLTGGRVSGLPVSGRLLPLLRAHGVPNWPDPTVDSEGRPGFNLVPIHGTDWNSPQIQNKIYQCEHVMPAGGGVPAIYPGGPG
jgi:hypothetical protein